MRSPFSSCLPTQLHPPYSRKGPILGGTSLKSLRGVKSEVTISRFRVFVDSAKFLPSSVHNFIPGTIADASGVRKFWTRPRRAGRRSWCGPLSALVRFQTKPAESFKCARRTAPAPEATGAVSNRTGRDGRVLNLTGVRCAVRFEMWPGSFGAGLEAGRGNGPPLLSQLSCERGRYSGATGGILWSQW